VRPDKLDISDLHSVRECHVQSVFVARDVEDNAVVSNDAGISVLGFDLGGGPPLSAADFPVSSF
jgi:hypothetical protein